MPIEKILPLLNFGFGFAGFVSSLLPKGTLRPRSHLLILLACLAAFISTGSALLWQSHQRSAHIQEIAEDLLGILAKEAKSIDQLHEGLPYEDLGTVTEALETLVKAHKVGDRLVEVKDDANLRYAARLYFRE